MAVLESSVPAQGTAGTVQARAIGEAAHAGTVTSVVILPEGNVTANATNYRTISVVNKGQSGSGTTVIASLALDTPTTDDLTAYDEKTIPLSVVADATTVAAGDVIAVSETVAASGLAHGGYRIRVVYDA